MIIFILSMSIGVLTSGIILTLYYSDKIDKIRREHDIKVLFIDDIVANDVMRRMIKKNSLRNN